LVGHKNKNRKTKKRKGTSKTRASNRRTGAHGGLRALRKRLGANAVRRMHDVGTTTIASGATIAAGSISRRARACAIVFGSKVVTDFVGNYNKKVVDFG